MFHIYSKKPENIEPIAKNPRKTTLAINMNEYATSTYFEFFS